MHKLGLDRRQGIVFLAIVVVITAPFLLLTIAGQIRGESGLIMLPIFVVGLPWELLWLILPIQIPGWNAPPTPGDNLQALSVPELFGFLLPVYINVYLFCLVVIPKKSVEI